MRSGSASHGSGSATLMWTYTAYSSYLYSWAYQFRVHWLRPRKRGKNIPEIRKKEKNYTLCVFILTGGRGIVGLYEKWRYGVHQSVINVYFFNSFTCMNMLKSVSSRERTKIYVSQKRKGEVHFRCKIYAPCLSFI